jgi:hypothetical protein
VFKCLKAKKHRAKPREVCLRHSSRHALRVHYFRAWHRGQPRKSRCNHQNGSYPRSKGRAEGHELPCDPQSLHLASRREGAPSVSSPKKSEHLSWTLEAEEALTKLKATLSKPPILVPPATGEPLLLYVAATTQVVSTAIVIERAEEGHALLV